MKTYQAFLGNGKSMLIEAKTMKEAKERLRADRFSGHRALPSFIQVVEARRR
jgi:hypothetical protein